MLDIIKSSPNGNGAINGRGLAHRKLWPGERVALAADVATKQRAYDPSLGQLADIFGVSVTQLRAELKAREANQRYEAELEAMQAAERRAAEAVSVVSPPAPVKVGPENIDLNTLFERVWTATPDELLALGQFMGPGVVWDRMISPLLDARPSDKTNGNG
jgi:hypothetical protein